MTQAAAQQTQIDQQLQLLIEQYKRDYSQVALLQQFLQLGMAHGRYALIEQHVTDLLSWGQQTEHFLLIIANMQENQQHYDKAAATIRRLFELPCAKTDGMYLAAGRLLPRSGNKEDLEHCCGILKEGSERYPNNTDIVEFWVEALQMQGRTEEVIALYKNTIRRLPFAHSMHFGLGLMTMIHTNLSDGFATYQHRFELPSFKQNTPFLPWTEWQGEPLKGKKLYLWSEQGIGDIAMWCGLLPWLIDQGADITFAVLERMIPLVKRSFPGITVVPKQLILPQTLLMTDFDYHCPLGNLMRYALPHTTPREHGAYLVPDKHSVEQKRSEYLATNPKATRLVGLSWHSIATSGWRRNIPLETLSPLLQDENTVYVALQYDQQQQQVAAYNAQHTQPILIDTSFNGVADINMWAAQHAAMDEVLSIQNSTVHMAGALGVKGTIFLPAYGAFHWGNGSNPNRWYSSITICQQQVGQSWQALINAYKKSI